MTLTRIEASRLLALKMVLSMMCKRHIKPMDACIIAAKRHGVSPYWLWRQVTE